MLDHSGLSKINIAIDGYSSCGKSTLAKDLAQSLNYLYIDSGAMYRAVTLFVLRHGIDLNEHEAITAVAASVQISFQKEPTGHKTYLDGVNVEHQIRDMDVTRAVSPVATISGVRRALVKQQQFLGHNKGVVMDGRDIGTVVFPDAELKIFLTAAMETRVQRRFDELLNNGYSPDYHEVMASITERDRIDTSREDSPLTKASDAIEIDNTFLSREEQWKIVRQLARERIIRSPEAEG